MNDNKDNNNEDNDNDNDNGNKNYKVRPTTVPSKVTMMKKLTLATPAGGLQRTTTAEQSWSYTRLHRSLGNILLKIKYKVGKLAQIISSLRKRDSNEKVNKVLNGKSHIII